jgi:predicted O-methyltransferase YrrM
MSRKIDPGAAMASPSGARALMVAGRIPEGEREWARRIEARRSELLADERMTRASNLEFEGPMEVSEAAWWLSLPPVWCQFLMRLVSELGPRSSIELGSGVGISGAYQAAGLRRGEAGGIVTLDSNPDWAKLAREGFEDLGLAGTIELRLGDIAETLPGVLEEIAPLDYAFVDAEHTEEGTIAYFDALSPHLAPEAVVVVDDVTFPEQSRRAWRTIRRRPRVGKSVGLGRVGVVVVR